VQLLPVEGQLETGSTYGKQKRVINIALQVVDSLDIQVGTSLSKLYALKMDNESELNSGVFKADIEDDFNIQGGNLYIVHNAPTPCTVMTATREIEFRD